MTPQRWKQIEAIFNEVIAVKAGERTAFLEHACRDDRDLRSEVEGLLGSHEESESFMATLLKSDSQRLIGHTLQNYQLLDLIGRGGMGAVYRAKDLTLKRDVAIKVLPAEFSRDRERVARFQREAEMLASLNHPNIGAIFGVQEVQGVRFLILELIMGETLADRIARGPIAVDKTLNIALQIAEALEAAHENGIVHRDLKPANIKLTPEGKVKVLDFGLAKLSEKLAGTGSSEAPTIGVSTAGVILGTPAYMAPEQAKGLKVDRPADVWAFGCVIYEMLSGKRAFRGEATSEVLVEVLKGEPAWNDLPKGTPAPIQRLLRRCLQKDIRSRLRDIADVRIEIEDAVNAPASLPGAERSRWVMHLAWVGALMVLVAAALYFGPPEVILDTRFVDIATPAEADAGGIALSPDGKKIAYTALTNRVPQLYVRNLENGVVSKLPLTGGAALPFWSPDGRSLGFFAESKLQRIDLETERIQPLADATLSPAGASWGSKGVILFSPNINGGTYKISERGGTATLAVEDGRRPYFLEDGNRFIFHSRGVFLGSLDSDERHVLLKSGSAMPGPSGHLLFLGQGGLHMQRFDFDRRMPVGTPHLLAQRVLQSTGGGYASVTASSTGDIAFRAGSQPRRLAFYDRSGNETRRVSDEGGFSPSLSPDEASVTVSRVVDGPSVVWLLDIARGVYERFTPGGGNQASLFSPDGREIIFSSARNPGRVQLYRKPVNGVEETLIPLPNDNNNKVATDWTQSYLLYRDNAVDETSFDIWALPVRGGSEAFPVLKTPAAERDAEFSPDEKWIAYESNKTKRSEIFITRFPKSGREFQISTAGGAQVRWNPSNQNELFHLSLDGRLMAVTLQFSSDSETVTVVKTAELFQSPIGDVLQGPQKQQYDVSRDGQRFFMSSVIEEALSPITLILNWKPAEN